jgi:uncharacterized membrane protein YebE (DUF533 family)
MLQVQITQAQVEAKQPITVSNQELVAELVNELGVGGLLALVAETSAGKVGKEITAALGLVAAFS